MRAPPDRWLPSPGCVRAPPGCKLSSLGVGAVAGAAGREVHLCGAPSGLPLPWFCELKHLQMCSGGQEGRGHGDTVLAIQYTLLHW